MTALSATGPRRVTSKMPRVAPGLIPARIRTSTSVTRCRTGAWSAWGTPTATTETSATASRPAVPWRTPVKKTLAGIHRIEKASIVRSAGLRAGAKQLIVAVAVPKTVHAPVLHLVTDRCWLSAGIARRVSTGVGLWTADLDAVAEVSVVAVGVPHALHALVLAFVTGLEAGNGTGTGAGGTGAGGHVTGLRPVAEVPVVAVGVS